MLHHFTGLEQPGTKVDSRQRRIRRPKSEEMILTVGPKRVEFIIPSQSPYGSRSFFSILCDEAWLEGATGRVHLENEDPWLFSRYIVPWLKGQDIAGPASHNHTCRRFSQNPTKALVDLMEVYLTADRYSDVCLMQYIVRAVDDILVAHWDQVKFPGDLLECILVEFPKTEDTTDLARLILGHIIEVLEAEDKLHYKPRHAAYYKACLVQYPRLANRLEEHKGWQQQTERETEEELAERARRSRWPSTPTSEW